MARSFCFKGGHETTHLYFWRTPNRNNSMSAPIPIRRTSATKHTENDTSGGIPSGKALSPSSAGAGASWLREPLLHFVLFGAVIFAVDHFLVSRSDNPNVIVVGAEVDSEAKQIFKASRNRDPSAAELQALRKVWLDNEVLYREGLTLGVDRGDTAIRERVIFKALSVVDASVKPPPSDDKILRAWFEKNRVRYEEPARFDFQEAVLPTDSTEAAVRAFVDTLNNGAPGDAKAGLRVFKGRPYANLAQSYGPDFAKALEESPPGEWRAQRSADGLRAVKLDAISSAKPAVFEVLKGVVRQDWLDAVMADQRSAAVAQLAQKYTIKLESAGTP
jgi:hypothetical protein